MATILIRKLLWTTSTKIERVLFEFEKWIVLAFSYCSSSGETKIKTNFPSGYWIFLHKSHSIMLFIRRLQSFAGHRLNLFGFCKRSFFLFCLNVVTSKNENKPPNNKHKNMKKKNKYCFRRPEKKIKTLKTPMKWQCVTLDWQMLKNDWEFPLMGVKIFDIYYVIGKWFVWP